MGHCLGPAANIEAISGIKWHLLICHIEAFYLDEVSLPSTDRGPDVIEKRLQEYRRSESWLAKAVPFLVCTHNLHGYTGSGSLPQILKHRRPCLSTCCLQVPIEILARLPCLVNVDTQHYSHVLTAAL